MLKQDGFAKVDNIKTFPEHGFARVYDCGVIKWVYQPFIR